MQIDAIRDYLDALKAFIDARTFDALLTGVQRPWQEVHSSIDVSTCTLALIGINDLDEMSALRRLGLEMTLSKLREKYPPESLAVVA